MFPPKNSLNQWTMIANFFAQPTHNNSQLPNNPIEPNRLGLFWEVRNLVITVDISTDTHSFSLEWNWHKIRTKTFHRLSADAYLMLNSVERSRSQHPCAESVIAEKKERNSEKKSSGSRHDTRIKCCFLLPSMLAACANIAWRRDFVCSLKCAVQRVSVEPTNQIDYAWYY